MKYLKWLKESTNFFKGGRGGSDRVPSPVAAYELVYGKKAPAGMRGMYPGKSEHKTWNGISIDAHIHDDWLDDLKAIRAIEMRASCEGHSKDWVTFIAFRVMPNKENDVKYLNKIKDSLNQGTTKCAFKVGQQGRPRFIVTSKLWFGQPGWEKWWSTLAVRVNKAVR